MPDLQSPLAPQPPRYFALVPCAGVGERSGAGLPKQYVTLAGRSVVAHTLAALAQVRRLSGTLVVLAPADDQFERYAPAFDGWVARTGGASRAQSVLNGLAELTRRGARPDDWVLVHDAARCLVQAAWIDALIDACAGDEVGGLLALPLPDTLKAEQDGHVAATVSREYKWLAQTPQMFRHGTLSRALTQAGSAVTDESSAIEALGLKPRLVRGEMENFKLTYPADFELAERLIRSRS